MLERCALLHTIAQNTIDRVAMLNEPWSNILRLFT